MWGFNASYHNWACYREASWGVNVWINLSTVRETISSRTVEWGPKSFECFTV